MSRPKPKIILSNSNSKTYKVNEILEAEATYAVYYQGKPINLRTFHSLVGPFYKYKKCSFQNPGHAFNLAERLNKLFKTTEFEVFRLIQGEKYIE